VFEQATTIKQTPNDGMKPKRDNAERIILHIPTTAYSAIDVALP
jgi:hypothetical protein